MSRFWCSSRAHRLAQRRLSKFRAARPRPLRLDAFSITATALGSVATGRAPKGQADNNSILCLGEVRSGRTWHQLGTVAKWSGSTVVFSRFSGTKWARHWWPYSRHFILRSNESQVPGVVSVNSPAYDWGFLAQCAAGVEKDHTGSCQAYDGDANGWLRFYRFSCSRPTGLVTCSNSLGDVMRYRR